MEKEKRIEVEAMLFGDYRVQVWDENNNSMLDREYFCRGIGSALATAMEIQDNLGNCKGLPIYSRIGDELLPISPAQQI